MIRVKDLSISFAGREVFSEGNFIVNRGERVGLIGRNGSGKSTFLKLILKQLEPDDGGVEIPRGYRIGYLEQHIHFTHATVLEEICSVLPFEREHEAWKGEDILYGLGFVYEKKKYYVLNLFCVVCIINIFFLYSIVYNFPFIYFIIYSVVY